MRREVSRAVPKVLIAWLPFLVIVQTALILTDLKAGLNRETVAEKQGGRVAASLERIQISHTLQKPVPFFVQFQAAFYKEIEILIGLLIGWRAGQAKEQLTNDGFLILTNTNELMSQTRIAIECFQSAGVLKQPN